MRNDIQLLGLTQASLTGVIFITMLTFSAHITSSQLSASSSVTDPINTSSWRNGTSMPTPRSAVAGVIIDEIVYIIGGWNIPDIIHPEMHLKTNTVEIFSIKNNLWSSVASLPQKLEHVAAAGYNGKLYVVGGDFGLRQYSSNKLFIYDPASDKWTQGKPMPTARNALTAAFIDGILYTVGGQDLTGVSVNTNEAYDPKTDTWTSKAPMPTPRHQLTSAVVDGKLYVFGGRTGYSSYGNSSSPYVNLNSNEMYDPISDTWTSKAPMPSNRSGLAAAASDDGKIYVFGGEDSLLASAMTFDNNEKYDPKTDRWTPEAPMPTARHGLAAVFDNTSKRIYVIGGGVEAGRSVSNINEILAVNSS